MRQRRIDNGTRDPARETAKLEPMADGPIPLDKRGKRNWISLSNDAIVTYAKAFMRTKAIITRSMLQDADGSMYAVLFARGLLETLGFDGYNEKCRHWSKMSDCELVDYARKFMEENGLSIKNDLNKKDTSLYATLANRKLLTKLQFRPGMKWASMDDDTLVEFAKGYIEKNGLTKQGLMKSYCALYGVLRYRKLLQRVFSSDCRNQRWSSASELQEFARKLIKERRITRLAELRKADINLCNALMNRKLVLQLGLTRREKRWEGLSDTQLLAMADNLIKAAGLIKAEELKKADSCLYSVLRERKLLKTIRYRNTRKWKCKSDEELISLAMELIRKHGMQMRSQLQRKEGGLYGALSKRGLLDQLGFMQQNRIWEGVPEQEIIDYAKSIIRDRGISIRKELQRIDGGLVAILRSRGIIDLVFVGIEANRTHEQEKGILSGLAQAPEAMERFGEEK